MFFSFLLLCVFFATDSCVNNIQGLFYVSHGVSMQVTNEQVLQDFITCNSLHTRNESLSAGGSLLFAHGTQIAYWLFGFSSEKSFYVKMYTGELRINRETEKNILKLVRMLKERDLPVYEVIPTWEDWQYEKMQFKKMLKKALRGY